MVRGREGKQTFAFTASSEKKFEDEMTKPILPISVTAEKVGLKEEEEGTSVVIMEEEHEEEQKGSRMTNRWRIGTRSTRRNNKKESMLLCQQFTTCLEWKKRWRIAE